MTYNDGFDGTVAGWLDEQAGRGAPDYLDEVLTRTVRTRQRPAWSSLERWLPVQTTLRFVPVPRLAWLLVVIALLAAVAVAAVLVVGSQTRQLPPPFGLARNGAIIYGADDHDIYRLDPVSGVATALIAGSTSDSAPWLSPDGTQFLFLRDAAPDPATDGKTATIMVAAANGTNVRPLAPKLDGIQNVAWSHDGTRVAVSAYVGGTPTLQLFTVVGQSQPLVIDTGGTASQFLAFRPGDREVTFLGAKGDVNGLYAVGVDGRGLRTIVPRDALNAILSPDGTKLAYTAWDGTTGTVHVADVATGRDTIPAFDPPSGGGVIDEASGWSPDGSQLMFGRYHGSTSVHFAVAPSSGGRVVEIGSGRTTTVTDYAQFSPDGTSVLAYYGIDKSTWLLDPTGTIPDRMLSGTIAERAAWERLAP